MDLTATGQEVYLSGDYSAPVDEQYDPSESNGYEENSWSSIYQRHRANVTSNPFVGMLDKPDDGSSMDEEFQGERHAWWVPILIIVGLVVIILIVVSVAIYCGLRGTLEEPPMTPKKKYDPNDEDAKSDQCSSVRLEIRSESRATCGSSRAGCMSVGASENTELQTLLVVPNNSSQSVSHPEPRRLDLQSLGIFEPQKSLAPIPAPPPSPSPIYKFTSNSAADTQTEDDEESASCSL